MTKSQRLQPTKSSAFKCYITLTVASPFLRPIENTRRLFSFFVNWGHFEGRWIRVGVFALTHSSRGGGRQFYLGAKLIKCIDPNEGEALKRGSTFKPGGGPAPPPVPPPMTHCLLAHSVKSRLAFHYICYKICFVTKQRILSCFVDEFKTLAWNPLKSSITGSHVHALPKTCFSSFFIFWLLSACKVGFDEEGRCVLCVTSGCA